MLALLVASLASAVVTWIAVGIRSRRLESVAKPLTLVLLIAWVAILFSKSPGLPMGLLLLGLVAALIGDVLLLRPWRRLIAGMAAFLVTQLAYVAAFNYTGPVRSWWSLAIAAAVLLVAVAGFVSLSRRARWHRRRGLKGATLVYATSLALMLWSATTTLLRPEWPPWAAGMVLAGGVLFCLSDAVLGWAEFVRPNRKGLVFVMVTYHLAQIALAVGFAARLGGTAGKGFEFLYQ